MDDSINCRHRHDIVWKDLSPFTEGLVRGDPTCDLLVAWTFFSAKARDIFRSAPSVDDATWMRGRGGALSFGLIAFAYYQKTNPVLACIAKRSIDEVLADDKSTP